MATGSRAGSSTARPTCSRSRRARSTLRSTSSRSEASSWPSGASASTIAARSSIVSPRRERSSSSRRTIRGRASPTLCSRCCALRPADSDVTDPHPPNARRAATWRRYLRFWGPRTEADVDDELRFHIEMRVRDYVERGMTEADARAATARRLGDLAANRAECLTITTRRERRMTRAQLIDALGRDAHFAMRTLGRQKGWTAVAIVTLALGIGANTAVFSVVNSLLLHPLPYPHADRVAIVFLEPTQGNQTGMSVMISPRPALLRAWRESARSFEDIEGYSTADMTLVPPRGEAASVHTASILPSLTRFTDQHPLIGRTFTEQEVKEKAHVAMLSEPIWRSRYGSDSAVLGQTLSLDGTVFTVVGVMPNAFRLPPLFQSSTDVWLPLDM